METQEEATHSLKQTIILSFIAASLAILLLPEGFVLGVLFQNTVDDIPPITLFSSGTYIESLNNTYDKYINDGIGISITYSKTVGNYAGCIAPSNDSIEYEQQFISTPVKLIADTSEHKIFVASGYYDVMGEGTDQSIHAEVNVSCKTNTTNLGAIINPTTVDTNTIADVFDVEFDYGTVATTADLDTFAKNLLPDSIVIDKTQQPTKNGKVYQYYFTTSGQKTLGDPSPNWFNLLYDPTKHLALFWMTPDTQFPVWQDISSSGKSITLNPPVGNIIAN
jgi:hypothetical protein